MPFKQDSLGQLWFLEQAQKMKPSWLLMFVYKNAMREQVKVKGGVFFAYYTYSDD